MGTIPPATLAGDEILQKGTTNPISTQTIPQTTTEKIPISSLSHQPTKKSSGTTREGPPSASPQTPAPNFEAMAEGILRPV